jgi:hypothetical protein
MRSACWGAFFAVAVLAMANAAAAGNCALFARAETGIALYGQAGGWWDQAAGRYERGQRPAVGAILVFERSRHMPAGHVAVVSAVRGEREILIDDGDWYRGSVIRSVSVIDTSAANDWTSVAVLDLPSGKHGRDNPAFGFVYPHNISPDLDTYIADRRAPSRAGLVHLAVAGDAPPHATTPEHADRHAVKKPHHTRHHHGGTKHKTSHDKKPAPAKRSHD